MAMIDAKIIVLLIVIIITVTNIAANVLSTKQGRRKGVKLIIDIDETTYDCLKQIYNPEIGMLSPTYEAVVNGTPLDKLRAEIEALNEKVSVDYKVCLDKSAVLQIIDRYRNEVSE